MARGAATDRGRRQVERRWLGFSPEAHGVGLGGVCSVRGYVQHADLDETKRLKGLPYKIQLTTVTRQ